MEMGYDKCIRLISEWDDANELSPEQVSYGSNKKVMWHGACGHRWEPYEVCVCIMKTDDSREACLACDQCCPKSGE